MNTWLRTARAAGPAASSLALLLVLATASTSPAQSEGDEPVIPLAPIDVTAQYPLTPPEPKGVSKPPYPEAARRRQEQGTVDLVIKVLANGNVGEIRVKTGSGSQLLDDAAATEAKSWQFAPGRRGPKAVDAWVEIPVRFQLVE
jgi:periplasmic protein TonB